MAKFWANGILHSTVGLVMSRVRGPTLQMEKLTLTKAKGHARTVELDSPQHQAILL